MNDLIDNIKDKISKFDPKLKMLIMVMTVITIVVVIFFGPSDDSDGEIPIEEGQKELKEISEDYKSGKVSRSRPISRSSSVKSRMGSSEELMKS